MISYEKKKDIGQASYRIWFYFCFFFRQLYATSANVWLFILVQPLRILGLLVDASLYFSWKLGRLAISLNLGQRLWVPVSAPCKTPTR